MKIKFNIKKLLIALLIETAILGFGIYGLVHVVVNFNLPKKESYGIQEFKAYIEEKGYQIINEDVGYFIAYKGNDGIEYYEGKTISNAKKVYDKTVQDIKEGAENYSLNSIDLDNYEQLYLSYDDHAETVSRNNKKIVYTFTYSDNEEEVINILSDTGYYANAYDIGNVLKRIVSKILPVIGFILLIPLLSLCVFLYTWFIIFKRFNLSGWYVFIPFYNKYNISKLTLDNGWFFLLLYVPVLNVIVWSIMLYKIGEKHDLDMGFNICNIFFSSITMQMLALANVEKDI